MNDYMNGYSDIPNKLNEDSSEYFKTIPKSTIPKFSSQNRTKPNTKKKTTPIIPVAGKTSTKSSANTKHFLAEMRRKKMKEQS